MAIFRIESLVVYNDQNTAAVSKEGRLFEKIFSFQETPQYLRRDLFKVDPDLAFIGVLPPLRTPHHPDRSEPEVGMIRDAVVVSGGAISMVNAGFKQKVLVKSRLTPQARITIRLMSVGGQLDGEVIDPGRLSIYWGPKVQRADQALEAVIKRGNQDLTISTSRKGTDVRGVIGELQSRWKSAQRPLVLFGSPAEGIPEILARTGSGMSSVDFNVNFIPEQGVETVRTEEALLASLSVLNLMEEA
jgi:methyltransferase